jgi:hypothetical protein
MRNQLFRNAPVLVPITTQTVAALWDVDGAEPFTLFIENQDLAAVLRTALSTGALTGPIFRGKNANLVFTAVTRGTGGNAITVAITTAPNQAFSVAAVGNAITINLQCDASGFPNSEKNYAARVADSMNANGPIAALVTTSLEQGSDGLAQLEVSPFTGGTSTTGALTLTGGAASTVTGATEVAFSPLPALQTPSTGWVIDTQAGTDIGATIAANTTVAREFTSGKAPGAAQDVAMFRSIRVRVTGGAAATTLVVSAITKRKIL